MGRGGRHGGARYGSPSSSSRLPWGPAGVGAPLPSAGPVFQGRPEPAAAAARSQGLASSDHAVWAQLLPKDKLEYFKELINALFL